MDGNGRETIHLCGERPATNRLSYGTSNSECCAENYYKSGYYSLFIFLPSMLEYIVYEVS
jgi:hypothetical protein